MPKSANRQFLTKVEGIEGYWATKSGGEVTSDSNKVWDGGASVPEVLASPSEVGDLTLARPYDPLRDQPILTQLIPWVGQWLTTVSVTPTTGDLRAATVKQRVYSGCLLTGIREPEADASSGDAADLELTFAVAAAS